jgi:uncharacterized membrane protein YebE (DUF533 family)
MKSEYPNDRELTPEELDHLELLKSLIQNALADGKLSEGELQSIKAFINADHQVTFQELQILRKTIREVLGDAALEYDWG